MPIKTVHRTLISILDALHTYQFLTLKQMERIGLGSAQALRKCITREDYDHDLIDYIDGGMVPGEGRLPRMYFITPKGCELLAEAWRMDLASYHAPAVKKVFSQDFHHRHHTVDVRISAERWARENGGNILFYENYFAGGGKGGIISTTLEIDGGSITPDSVFGLQHAAGAQLFVVEVSNAQKTSRIVEQAKRHAFALSEKVIQKQYDFSAPPLILLVFESHAVMKRVFHRMECDTIFSQIKPFFAFQTLEEVIKNFSVPWYFLDNSQKPVIIQPQAYHTNL